MGSRGMAARIACALLDLLLSLSAFICGSNTPRRMRDAASRAYGNRDVGAVSQLTKNEAHSHSQTKDRKGEGKICDNGRDEDYQASVYMSCSLPR